MSFEQLVKKVTQAEQSLEAHERTVGADYRQLKESWRAAWTPGRIVIAGLASGALVGKMQPKMAATGHGVLQLVSALSGLVASGSASAAAGVAQQVSPDGSMPGLDTVTSLATAGTGLAESDADVVQRHERLRGSGW